MNWNEILQTIIYPALAGVVTTLVGVALSYVLDVLKRLASNLKHAQAAGVIADAVLAAWASKIKPSLTAKLADGKLTDEEWNLLREDVKEAARQIAVDRLKDLRGFAPRDAGKWVEVQLESALGKLLGGVLNGEETDPLANTPASEA